VTYTSVVEGGLLQETASVVPWTSTGKLLVCNGRLEQEAFSILGGMCPES